MLFNSIQFIVFLILVLGIYYILPNSLRLVVLCISGFYFYMSWDYRYGALLGTVMLLSYGGALYMQNKPASYRKTILICCISIDILLLFVFKYTNMLLQTANTIKGIIGESGQFPFLQIVLPVGISFYIFQSIGYLIDVYWEKTEAEKSFWCFGAFIAFFPQLVAGPIERSSNLLRQMRNLSQYRLKEKDFYTGIFQMLFGYFEKVVIADCVAEVVTAVYTDYMNFAGIYIVLATILFAIQIYCDFDGYTNIAIGVARLFGIQLIKNFNTPYLSTCVTDFWRRWHISLSTWFRDYVYIPLGGNRQGKKKKYRNLLITFLISGLWHGANWNFVAWGGIHGCYQILEDKLGINKKQQKSLWGRCLRCFLTFLLVDFAWLFFRADSLMDAFKMLNRILVNLQIRELVNREKVIQLHLTIEEWLVLLLAIVILACIDCYKYHLDQKSNLVGIVPKNIYQYAYQWPIWIRSLSIVVIIWLLVIFGHYGPQFNAAQFIYFQF